MGGFESAEFNDGEIDEERLRRIAQAAAAEYGPAMFVLARILGITTDQLVELQQTFREVIEESPDPEVE